MKRYYLLSIVMIAFAGSVYASDVLPSAHPGMYDAGAINARDMELKRQYDFRRQEYDDFKTLQEVKNKHEKDLDETVLPERTMFEKLLNRKAPAKFVEQDGQIKIEHIENN